MSQRNELQSSVDRARFSTAYPRQAGSYAFFIHSQTNHYAMHGFCAGRARPSRGEDLRDPSSSASSPAAVRVSSVTSVRIQYNS